MVGERIKQEAEKPGGGLVTGESFNPRHKSQAKTLIGVVMAVLGMETASGDFEVIDICFAGLPDLAASAPQPLATRPANGDKGKGKAQEGPVWVAVLSGVSAGSEDVPEDLKAQLLAEWLMGEGGGGGDEGDLAISSRIAHVVFAGNSLAAPVRHEDDRKPRKYGYDASTYSPHPTMTLDALLVDMLAGGLNVHVLPGAEDPVGVTLPQQPFPRAMLRNASMGGGDALRMHTNPCWFELGGKSFLGTGGQTIDDVYKYVHSEDRLAMALRTLEWRHVAPTAPDTLWCFPFADKDPFIIDKRPHVYLVGNQPEFATSLVRSEDDPDASPTRVVLVPRFAETGLIALVDIASPDLTCRTVQIAVPEWEMAKVKVTMTEEEIEQARRQAEVVRSDLDLMADGDDW